MGDKQVTIDFNTQLINDGALIDSRMIWGAPVLLDTSCYGSIASNQYDHFFLP